jgi:hypothetical protein
MGLENLMPSNSLAMAVASSNPIHIGNVLSPSISFRITMGLFVNGSTVKPDMSIGLSIPTPFGNSLSYLEHRGSLLSTELSPGPGLFPFIGNPPAFLKSRDFIKRLISTTLPFIYEP